MSEQSFVLLAYGGNILLSAMMYSSQGLAHQPAQLEIELCASAILGAAGGFAAVDNIILTVS